MLCLRYNYIKMLGEDYVKDFAYILRGSPLIDMAMSVKDKKQKWCHCSEDANTVFCHV